MDLCYRAMLVGRVYERLDKHLEARANWRCLEIASEGRFPTVDATLNMASGRSFDVTIPKELHEVLKREAVAHHDREIAAASAELEKLLAPMAEGEGESSQ